MRHWSLLLVCLSPFVGAGCGFASIIRKNVVYSPLYAVTEKLDHHRHVQLAHEAWMQMATRYTEFEFSCDYRSGFVDGFADYLDYGGIGEPPPIPPPGYRLSGYETPTGLALMEEWNAGFRHGASTAKFSGLRTLVTIPVYMGPTYPTATVNPPRPKVKSEKEVAPVPKPIEPAPVPMADPPKVAVPIVEPPKPEPRKVEPPKAEPPKADPLKIDLPKGEGPKVPPPPAEETAPSPIDKPPLLIPPTP